MDILQINIATTKVVSLFAMALSLSTLAVSITKRKKVSIYIIGTSVFITMVSFLGCVLAIVSKVATLPIHDGGVQEVLIAVVIVSWVWFVVFILYGEGHGT